MKKTSVWLGLLGGMGVAMAVAAAEDFSAYSTERLQQMRGEARNMSDADRAAYRAEMQKRMRQQNSGDSTQLRNRSNEEMGRGTTTRQRSMDGSGSGKHSGGGRRMGR